MTLDEIAEIPNAKMTLGGFAGKDVVTILGYAKPLNALDTHVDVDDSLKQGLIDNIGKKI